MKACLELRQKMLEQDHTNVTLAHKIHRSASQMSAILCARKVADAADIYAIGTALDIPPEEWGRIFFPPEVVKLIAAKIGKRG